MTGETKQVILKLLKLHADIAEANHNRLQLKFRYGFVNSTDRALAMTYEQELFKIKNVLTYFKVSV